MSTRVSNQPNCPLPTDNPEYETFLSKFLSEIPGNSPPAPKPQQLPPMSMEQPPEQPMIDSLSFQFSDSAQIVKQEKQSGFLDVWGSLEGEVELDPDRFSPEDKKCFSSLVKEELHCKIKLKLISEGKDTEEVTDNQTATKEYPISEETKELQRVRREKNREAAKKCRQKKKTTEHKQEIKIRESEQKIREMNLQLNESMKEFTGLLDNFKNFPCFMAYLRQNKRLLSQPDMKQELKRYVEKHGGQFSSSGHHSCCLCPRAVAVAVAPQPSTTPVVAPHFPVPY